MSRIRIFFASDIHGSELTFLKFLNAYKFYKANILIIGGDITGKAILPIFKMKDGTFKANFLDEKFNIKEKELEGLITRIKNVGYYPYITDENEWIELINDQKKIDDLLIELEIKRLKEWINITEKYYKDLVNKVKIFIMPGNDDRFEIDNILNASNIIINPDNKVLEIDNEHEMLSLGYSNITPWKCPRDIQEDELYKKIENLANKINSMERAIFLIHVPPFNSGLDIGPKLTEDLKPVLSPGGGMTMNPVGSLAVRKAIEKFQPLLGLHGHIHESRGAVKIGKTLCINPGSEYSEGILRGALIEIDKNKVIDYLLTSG
jgi:Icc-related predicted phosphoesterase